MSKRSKPRATVLPKISANHNDFEIRYLKHKNAELVKALVESKSAYTGVLNDSNILQKELFVLNLRCVQLVNCIKRMESHSKACMNMIVSASNYTAELIYDAHNILRVKSAVQEPESSRRDSGSPNHSKTHAVKPMIDGHIYKPTINLQRVNEISPEEIPRLQLQSDAKSSQNPDNNNDNYENDAKDDFENSTPEVSFSSGTNNNRLDTMHETDEELSQILRQESRTSFANSTANPMTLSESNSQLPLLSGVFRDVQVYLSPIQDPAQYLAPCQHVTTQRGSRKRFNLSCSMLSLPAEATASQSNSNTFQSSPLLNSFSRKNDQLSNGVTTPHPNETASAKDLDWISIAAKCESTTSSRSLDTSADESIRFNTILRHRKKRIIRDSTSSTENDPLEGPSNLLDQEMENKIDTLSGKRTESLDSAAQGVQQRRKLKSTKKKTNTESLSTKMKQSVSPSSPKVLRSRTRKTINLEEPALNRKMRRSK